MQISESVRLSPLCFDIDSRTHSIRVGPSLYYINSMIVYEQVTLKRTKRLLSHVL